MVNYPIYLSLKDRQILVVGGGVIATRKVLALTGKGARISVVAPEISQELADLPDVVLFLRSYQVGDLDGKFMIFICTNDASVNRTILKQCLPEQLVNDCTDKTQSNFYNMAMIECDDIELAISSKGSDPSLTKKLKNKIIDYLEQLKTD